MRSIARIGRLAWLPALALFLISGCQQAQQPPAATTTPPAESKTPTAAALEEQSPGDTEPSAETPSEPSTETPAEPSTEPSGEKPSSAAPAGDEIAAQAPSAERKSSPPAAAVKRVPLVIELPAPAFRGTPVPLKEPHVEKPRGGPRPEFLVPEGTVDLARGKLVSTSDPSPEAGEVDFVTDGDKEASDFGVLVLDPGPQWVEIDLGREAAIYAVLVWHNHGEARVYRDVVVQVSDDPDFLDAVTVFNNDYDNSAGLGVGEDLGYVETSEGKLIDAQGVEGRYVRLYSNGNHLDGENHYTEVEVFGKSAP